VGRYSIRAAAGCGKTEYIARCIAEATSGRFLILTHSNAGVHSITNRLRTHRVNPSRYHVETIARFTLRFCRSYRAISGYFDDCTLRGSYVRAATLFRDSALRRILSSSYDKLFVDEYQDCSVEQHELILALSDILPCTILGDPLQGIFGFNEQLVDWDVIDTQFERSDPLTTPFRWQNTNPRLGIWLTDVRTSLIESRSISLTNAPVHVFQSSHIIHECFRKIDAQGSVVGLVKWPDEAKRLSARLSGKFQMADEVEMNVLKDVMMELDQAQTGIMYVSICLEFLCECFSGLKKPSNSIRSKLKDNDDDFSGLRANRWLINGVQQMLNNDKVAGAINLFSIIKPQENIHLYRRDILSAMAAIFKEKQANPSSTLQSLTNDWIERRRHWYYRPSRLMISRPLLVKGLEFAHCLVLKPELTNKELYVALTRGSHSLSICSDSQQINVQPPTVRFAQALSLFD
jgi:hypothetical protein